MDFFLSMIDCMINSLKFRIVYNISLLSHHLRIIIQHGVEVLDVVAETDEEHPGSVHVQLFGHHLRDERLHSATKDHGI